MRRALEFDNWDAVEADLQQLLEGYTQHGKWNLEQTSRHLNDWIRFPIDGFDPAPIPMRWLLGLVRITAGKRMLAKILREGRMSNGVPTAPATVYAAGETPHTDAAVQELLQTIARFRQHDGPIHASPVFGEMDKATAEQLQLVHFAHHLSWLTPTATATD